MSKEFTMTVAVLGAVIGGLVFRDQVLAIFAGMTVMESLSYITQFVLHVVVVTIAMYVATTLPELVKPWMKALKSRKSEGRRMTMQAGSRKAEGGRTTTEALMRAYLLSQLPKHTNQPATPSDETRIEF